jgi:hypothetical protein
MDRVVGRRSGWRDWASGMTGAAAWLIWAVVISAVVLTSLLWIKRLPYLSKDFLFLIFFTSTVAYLEVAPLAVLLRGDPQTTIERYVLPGPRTYLVEHAEMCVAALLLFQLPLVLIYYARLRPRSVPDIRTVVATRSASLVAGLALLMPIFFLWVGYRHNLIAIRSYGQRLLTVALVTMPPAEFLVYRLYQETAIFLTGITFFILVRSTGMTRRIAAGALAANLVAYGIWGLTSSRSAIVLMAVCLTAWWLRVYPARLRWGRAVRRIVIVAMLAGVGVSIAINFRTLDARERVGVAVLNPFRLGMFGDNQGYARLDCVDLLARLDRAISSEGAAWGEAWYGYTWIVRRFIDPAGFDQFRLSMRTTAKGFLMRRYLRVDAVDYYSCSLVDLFGNFNWLGFPLAALVFGGCFRFFRTAMFRPSSGTSIIAGVFVVTSILYFDQEAGITLFGWVRQLPVVVGVIVAKPFAVRREP